MKQNIAIMMTPVGAAKAQRFVLTYEDFNLWVEEHCRTFGKDTQAVRVASSEGVKPQMTVQELIDFENR